MQLTFLLLFIGGNYWGWNILKGDFSSAKLLNNIPLSDPFAVLQIFVSGFVVATEALIGAVIIFFLYAIIGGRSFCAWVCPLNIVTDIAIWIRKKADFTGVFNLKLPKYTKYLILALSLLLSAAFGIAAFEMISPIGIWHRGIIYGISSGWAIIVFVFLFDLILIKNGWCGHLCPLGAFYSIIGRFGLLRVKHKLDKCTNCMDCFEVCPEEQVLAIVTKESGIIKSSDCTNCGRCIEICKDKSLVYSLNQFKRK